MALESEIVVDVEGAEAIAEEWDRLAVVLAKPYCTPGWMLAWWRNSAPPGAGLRLVCVRDGGRLIGLAPLWAEREAAGSSRYEFLGARLASPVGPIAEAGREPEVAAELTRALAAASPRVQLLEFEDEAANGWRARLIESWPGRPPWLLEGKPRPLPIVAIGEGGYEGWFAGRSSKFRQRARRGQRRLLEKGAELTLADAAGLDAALDDFERLHGTRWEEHGGSNALVSGLRQMFLEMGGELLEQGRLRVFVLAAESEAIVVWILLAAGAEVCAWNTGFDESWSELSPAFYAMLSVIEDAAERGESTISFGSGTTELKLRLADRMDEVSRDVIVPHGRAYPLSRLRLLPAQARRFASRKLSDDAKARLRRVARRR
jgi:CelD/BcsL family acetyltransferase involved in cellulose biosynthesis